MTLESTYVKIVKCKNQIFGITIRLVRFIK